MLHGETVIGMVGLIFAARGSGLRRTSAEVGIGLLRTIAEAAVGLLCAAAGARRPPFFVLCGDIEATFAARGGGLLSVQYVRTFRLSGRSPS